MKEYTLEQRQRERVEENLEVVRIVIRTRFSATIKYNNFEYEELFQEGCMKLCEVASRFPDVPEEEFQRIGYTAVKNHLLNFVTRSLQKRNHYLSLDASNDDEGDDGVSFADSVVDEDNSMFADKVIDKIVTDEMLEDYHRIRKAIEAIKGTKHSLGFDIILDQYRGMSGEQITTMYNIPLKKVNDYVEHARDYYRRFKHMEDRKAALLA